MAQAKSMTAHRGRTTVPGYSLYMEYPTWSQGSVQPMYSGQQPVENSKKKMPGVSKRRKVKRRSERWRRVRMERWKGWRGGGGGGGGCAANESDDTNY